VTWKRLKYGFAIALSTLAITGTTIYQVSRKQVKARDCIELMQRTIECCLAVGTNNVALPNYVKTFTTYIYTNMVIINLGYDTTNTLIYTNEVLFTNGSVTTNYLITTNNVVLTGTNHATNTVTFVITNSITLTNAIGNYVDKDYLTTLDPIIEALTPYFVVTNTLYDGTTNIVMQTFTGQLTQLDIGDHTNFTPYGWYVSQSDLKERYKVLNKYEICQRAIGAGRARKTGADQDESDWATAKSDAEANFAITSTSYYENVSTPTYCDIVTFGSAKNNPISAAILNSEIYYIFDGLSTQMNGVAQVWVLATTTWGGGTGFEVFETNPVYVFNSLVLPSGNAAHSNAWSLFDTITNSYTSRVDSATFGDVTDLPDWCQEPTEAGYDGTYLGLEIQSTNVIGLVVPDFTYCTNALP